MKSLVLFLMINLSCLIAMKGQSMAEASYQKMQNPFHLVYPQQLNRFTLKPLRFDPPFLSPINSGVRYDAFFCKMELKNRERFHIWIKVHAGEYDNYTHDTGIRYLVQIK